MSSYCVVTPCRICIQLLLLILQNSDNASLRAKDDDNFFSCWSHITPTFELTERASRNLCLPLLIFYTRLGDGGWGNESAIAGYSTQHPAGKAAAAGTQQSRERGDWMEPFNWHCFSRVWLTVERRGSSHYLLIDCSYDEQGGRRCWLADWLAAAYNDDGVVPDSTDPATYQRALWSIILSIVDPH